MAKGRVCYRPWIMPRKSLPLPTMRPGEPLRIGREAAVYGRNAIAADGPNFVIQHRFFVIDPWELLAEAIHRAVPSGSNRDTAHSFRRQAEDYFGAATASRELAVRPVLMYYAFLNLSKAYAIAKGSTALTGRTSHGISSAVKPRAIASSSIKFEKPSAARPGVFQELLKLLDGNPVVLNGELRLGHLLPQILPGHRLWCYAGKRPERFLSVDRFEVCHDPSLKALWLNLVLAKEHLSADEVLNQADFAADFELIGPGAPGRVICLQQKTPQTYTTDPGEAFHRLILSTRNRFWETVKITSPYRKPYVYCCPSGERKARVPQLLSIYLLMFFLGSVTRYTPLYFDDLLESKHGPFFETFVSESPMQFLYLMASEILGREVSKPAIV